jgi:hypothetical protein
VHGLNLLEALLDSGLGLVSLQDPGRSQATVVGEQRVTLKSAIRGTYHAFAFAKYAHRYLAEFQYRFNRRFNMKTILTRLLNALVAAPASSERCLRLAEAFR